jgi:phosphocarrier protein
MVVENKLGFHARPAAMIAKLASRFDSEITIEKGGTKVSAKSLMGLLSLEASKGSKIRIMAIGVDAQEAVAEIEELVKGGLEVD